MKKEKDLFQVFQLFERRKTGQVRMAERLHERRVGGTPSSREMGWEHDKRTWKIDGGCELVGETSRDTAAIQISVVLKVCHPKNVRLIK